MNKRFGELLNEGFSSVAKRQGKKLDDVKREVAESLNYSSSNIHRWLYHGKMPKDATQVAFLVRYCADQGRIGRDWANSLLAQAHYPHREALLDELFPKHSQRTEVPHVYQNLPPHYGDFLGRDPDLARVLEGLGSRWPMISIEGMGGVGKTTLAIETAYRCLLNGKSNLTIPFETAIWISAKDRPEQKHWLDEVLAVIAKVLDFPYIIELSLEQKLLEVDNLLRIHRALIIIDNFETIEDPELEQWMQKVPEPSKVLITGRYARHRRVWDIHLRGLEEPEALKLIRQHAQRLGLQALVAASDEVLSPLTYITEGNPMAIEMSLGHIKRGALNFAEMVDNLYNASQRVNDIFDYLYRHAWEFLSEDARRVLMVMPCFVGTASKEAIGTSSSLGDFPLAAALEQLIESSLINNEESVSGKMQRYSIHPLTQAFARGKALESKQEQVVRERWLDYWISFVDKYGILDSDDPLPFQRLATEWPNVNMVYELLLQTKDLVRLIYLIKKTENFMHIYGYWEQRVALYSRVLELAEEVADEQKIGLLSRYLGWTMALQDRFDEAQTNLNRALDIAKRCSDFDLLEGVYSSLTLIGQRSKDLTLFSIYKPLWESIIPAAHRDEIRRVRRYLEVIYREGTVEFDRGNFDKAEKLFKKMVEMSRQARWERAIAYGLNYLGELAIRRSEMQEAQRYLTEGWEIIQRWQDKRRIAYFCRSFASLSESQGNLNDAISYAYTAHDFFHRLGMRQEAAETGRIIERLEASS